MSGEQVVTIEDLEVRYGRIRAVEGLDLVVGGGQVVAVVGRNGSGKSSMVRTLLGLIRPRAGRCLLFGEDSWRRRARLMARVGVVPEHLDMPPDMHLAALGRFFGRVYPRWDGPGFATRLDRVGVPLDRPFGQLSKGQQRQGALALALGSEPELLVLDDPTLGLDPVARSNLYEEVVTDLADRGTTVLLTTHDLAGVEGIADRIAVMADGRVHADERVEDLKARWRRVRVGIAAAADSNAVVDALGERGVVVEGRTGNLVAGLWEVAQLSPETELESIAGVESVELTPLSLEEIFPVLCDGEVH